jgi:hypothetical protein
MERGYVVGLAGAAPLTALVTVPASHLGVSPDKRPATSDQQSIIADIVSTRPSPRLRQEPTVSHEAALKNL